MTVMVFYNILLTWLCYQSNSDDTHSALFSRLKHILGKRELPFLLPFSQTHKQYALSSGFYAESRTPFGMFCWQYIYALDNAMDRLRMLFQDLTRKYSHQYDEFVTIKLCGKWCFWRAQIKDSIEPIQLFRLYGLFILKQEKNWDLDVL